MCLLYVGRSRQSWSSWDKRLPWRCWTGRSHWSDRSFWSPGSTWSSPLHGCKYVVTDNPLLLQLLQYMTDKVVLKAWRRARATHQKKIVKNIKIEIDFPSFFSTRFANFLHNFINAADSITSKRIA